MSEVRQQYIVVQVVHCTTPENKFTMYTITHVKGYLSNTMLGSHSLGGKENGGEKIERRVCILFPHRGLGPEKHYPSPHGSPRTLRVKGNLQLEW